MAKTLKSAFNKFVSEVVNLDSKKTFLARTSRDNLISKLKSFPDKVKDFPEIYEEKIIKFGSFARNTKLRPLDDIDLILTFNAKGSIYIENGDEITITVPQEAEKLRELCDGEKLNSRKLIEKLKTSLFDINDYKLADIKRNQEAVTLQLKSYDWNFDVVPGFFTAEDSQGKTFYIIPDGKGNWKKTDPRIDQVNVTKVNKEKDGVVLEFIRIIKKWNKRYGKPILGSYLIENIVLNYCKNETYILDFREELPLFFKKLSENIFNEVLDNKGIQGDLNYLTLEEKIKISDNAKSVASKLEEALEFEKADENKKAINKMIEIFGEEFPKYE